MNNLEYNIEIRSKIHQVYFRKTERIQSYEFAILSIIKSAGGRIDFNELGIILGFSTKEIISENTRIDPAEIELLNHFLAPLVKYNLIEIVPSDTKTFSFIDILFWGEVALLKKDKYNFYSANISIPEFYRIQNNTPTLFDFKNLGFDLQFRNEKKISEHVFVQVGVNFELEYESNFKDSFLLNSSIDKSTIIIDYIEDTEIDFERNDVLSFISMDEKSENIKFLVKGFFLDSISELIAQENNSQIKNNLILRCELANYLSQTKSISIDEIIRFQEAINWEDIVADRRVIWDHRLMDLLTLSADGILIKDISENCDVSFINQNLSKYEEYWDWKILSDRLSTEVILNNLSKFKWDISLLLDRLEDKQIESNLQIIIEVIGDKQEDIYSLVPRISEGYLKLNYRSVPINLNLFIRNQLKGLEYFIFDFLEYPWDWNYICLNIDLQIALDNYSKICDFIQPNLNLFLYRVLDIDNQNEIKFSFEIIKTIIDNINSDEFSKFNSQSKIISDVNVLSLLNNKELIYFGDERFPGFEMNSHIIWHSNLVKSFLGYFYYKESVDSLSLRITSMVVIEDCPSLNWDFKVLSKNTKLISNNSFLIKYESKLDFLLVSEFIDFSVLITEYPFLSSKISVVEFKYFSEIISKRISLIQILEIEEKYNANLEIDDWAYPINLCEKEVLFEVIKRYDSTISHLNNRLSFSEAITKRFTISEILFELEFSWDWTWVTKELIKDGLDDEILEKHAACLFWPIIIQDYYKKDDLLLENQLRKIISFVEKGNDENVKMSWEVITRKYPNYDFNNALSQTVNDSNYKWDWDVISSTTKIDTKLDSLKKYKGNINWTLLSSNPVLNDIFNRFNKVLFTNTDNWKEFVINFLESFSSHWDFNKLSGISSITWNKDIVYKFIEKWDWDILSSSESKLLTEKESGSKKISIFRYSRHKLSMFNDLINWEIISKRQDVAIPIEIVEEFINRNWDWTELSKNPQFVITEEFLETHASKSWDWIHLSNANWLTHELLINLNHKPWNWLEISRNKNLIFGIELLNILSNKTNVDWDSLVLSDNLEITEESIKIFQTKQIDQLWDILSKSSCLFSEKDLLRRFRDKWNWSVLVELDKIDVNDTEILEEFESMLPWDTISKNSLFLPSVSVLKQFKDSLNWNILSRNLELDFEILKEFKDYLDWKIVSKNSKIEFTLQKVKEFINYLDLYDLKTFNPSLTKDATDFIDTYLENNINQKFIFKLKNKNNRWSGSIYHFTHITNAVEVIKSQKILSRNKAPKSFSDAAGNVVSLRDTAHEYARFYFRPQTPTQFYNECLGKDISSGRNGWKKNGEDWNSIWKPDLPKAMELGLPKCPIPVFFKFDIAEVLEQFPTLCEISDGNMQKSSTTKGPVSKMMHRFSFNDVYSSIDDTSDGEWRTYIDKSQQEFLVKEELNFSQLKTVEIFVRTESDKQQLIMLVDSKFASLIKVDYNQECFINKNKTVDYTIENHEFSITTDYKGNGKQNGEFWLETESEFDVISGKENILFKKGNRIAFYPNIKLKFTNEICFKAFFKDKVTNKPEWEVVKYCAK